MINSPISLSADSISILATLSDENYGAALRAFFHFAQTGERDESSLSEAAKTAFVSLCIIERAALRRRQKAHERRMSKKQSDKVEDAPKPEVCEIRPIASEEPVKVVEKPVEPIVSVYPQPIFTQVAQRSPFPITRQQRRALERKLLKQQKRLRA